MESLQQYIFSIICTALLCGILSALVPKGTVKQILSLLCGCVLTLVLIRPLGSMQWEAILENVFPYEEQAEEVSAIGAEMAKDAIASIIIARTEAYILEKAKALNAELIINICVNTENIPETVSIHGEISPFARKELESIIETDLGITKENQIWNG